MFASRSSLFSSAWINKHYALSDRGSPIDASPMKYPSRISRDVDECITSLCQALKCDEDCRGNDSREKGTMRLFIDVAALI